VSAPRIDSVTLEYEGGMEVELVWEDEDEDGNPVEGHWLAQRYDEELTTVSEGPATEQELRDAGLWVPNAEPLLWEGDDG
jgi:hypothetical protein